MTENSFDLIIIGGGPAGLTAAIYASRAGINTLIIEGSPAGGQLMITTDVENFPGFPNGVTGPEFVLQTRRQAEKFGTKFKAENVTEVSGNEAKGFNVTTVSSKPYLAKSLIIASGASAKWLGIESESRLIGKGVSACATCDGFFFKDKTVVVVGGGDSAMEEALFLTRFASKVYILVRSPRESIKASKFMFEKALSTPKIEFRFDTQIKEIKGDQRVEGLRLSDSKSGAEIEFNDVEGVFVAIGHKPNTSFLKEFLQLDELGYIVVTDNVFTGVRGVFCAGDVSDRKYRQAVTAAGLGCMAALEAEKFLSKNHLGQ